jgi:orotidine-5'-phosphate decarboxylase
MKTYHFMAGQAKEFAKMAFEAGLDGVVCSAFESKMIKEITDKNFLTLTPGIRPFGENAGDQKRVMMEAKWAGPESLVIIKALTL